MSTIVVLAAHINDWMNSHGIDPDEVTFVFRSRKPMVLYALADSVNLDVKPFEITQSRHQRPPDALQPFKIMGLRFRIEEDKGG